MTVTFSKEQSNYNRKNLVYLLENIPDKNIKSLATHPVDSIKVMGDIHNTQWTADNPRGLYWFRIKGTKDGKDVESVKSVHIYVCFRQFEYDRKTQKYIPAKCIVPKMIGNSGLPDISRLFGSWEFSKITYSH